MIDVTDISLQFGGKYLFKNVSFKINSGDKAALVGVNGSGKSSLLNIIYGKLQPEKARLENRKELRLVTSRKRMLFMPGSL